MSAKTSSSAPLWVRFCSVAVLLQLAACTSVSRHEAPQPAVAARSGKPMQAGKAAFTARAMHSWQHYVPPGKQATDFTLARLDGREAVQAKSTVSASLLRHRMRVEAGELGAIRFSWNVPQLIEQADMALREADDSPVRIVLAFEGDRALFSLKNAALSELMHAISGEPLPYATLMYVWCNTRPTGSVIINPRTDRIRELVVESGDRQLSRWIDYERNIRSDFEQAFGEPPGALVGIGIMTDTDNTRSSTLAWYGPLDLTSGH